MDPSEPSCSSRDYPTLSRDDGVSDTVDNQTLVDKDLIRATIVNICNMYTDTCAQAEEILEEDDEEENTVALIITTQLKETPNRQRNYVERTVKGYTDKEFQSHFRLQWATYEVLEALLGPELNTRNSQIPARKQQLAVLWLLATPDSFRSVGERFNLAKSNLSWFFAHVVQALNKHAGQIIKWPTDQKQEIKEKFSTFAGMRGCIGAIDGTFIEIKAPKNHPHVYTCRKCFYAIQLQAVAVPDLRFTDIFAGYPGSVGDRRVFLNSTIYKNITERKEAYFEESEYILGDKAYPVLTWCVPPYINRGAMDARKISFNSKHAKTRQVERAFALLFGRFRRLKFLDMNRLHLIPATILASCILHNLCLTNDNDLNFVEEAIEEGEEFMRLQSRRGVSGSSEEDNSYSGCGSSNDGTVFRDNLSLSLL